MLKSPTVPPQISHVLRYRGRRSERMRTHERQSLRGEKQSDDGSKEEQKETWKDGVGDILHRHRLNKKGER